MKKNILLVIFCLPMIIAAQEESSVQWAEGLTWEQVKEKAKNENKYIFVYAHATWCAPCRLMDKDVYSSEKVGRILNTKFIAVKLQMDSTENDNAQIRNWYADANHLKREFKLTSFPSFIFFGPNRKFVHRDLGYKDVNDLFKMIDVALDPEKLTYYQLFEDYKQNKKQFEKMDKLVLFVEGSIGDTQLTKKIARDYKENYLDNLPKGKLMTKDQFNFLHKFWDLVNSNDNFFNLCYYRPEEVDSIVGAKGFATRITKNLITKEEIASKLEKNNKPLKAKPNWEKIITTISKKYPEMDAKRLVLDYQSRYYLTIDLNWHLWAKFKDEKIKLYPTVKGGNTFQELNLPAWYIFLYCNDKQLLEKALVWSNLSISIDGDKANHQFYDTKANLLYKLGKVEEAIACEQKALELAAERHKKSGRVYHVSKYNQIIVQMRKGEPTCLEDGAVWDIKKLKK